jgi:hypothetical protein
LQYFCQFVLQSEACIISAMIPGCAIRAYENLKSRLMLLTELMADRVTASGWMCVV